MTRRSWAFSLLGWTISAGLAMLLVNELRSTAKHATLLSVEASDQPVLTLSAPIARQEPAMEIVERPLFFSSRRPLPPEPSPIVAPKQEPPPKLDFALVGVVLSQAGGVALIEPEKSKPMLATLGDSVGRWTITSIDADRIMVRSGNVVQLVGMREKGPRVSELPPEMRPSSSSPGTRSSAPHGPVRR